MCIYYSTTTCGVWVSLRVWQKERCSQMNIETRELIRYIEQQKQIFKMLGGALYSEFNDGVIQGLSLVKAFVELYENREGAEIAEALDGHKS